MSISKLWLNAGLLLTVAGGLAACVGGEEAQEEQAPAAEAPAASTPAPAPAAGGGSVPTLNNPPPGVTQEMAVAGQAIFNGQGICYTCHGQNGTGTALAPNQNDDQWLHITATDPAGKYEQIVQIINQGVSQPKQFPAPMPAKGGAQLSDEQVRQAAAYVYAISQRGRQ